jgi:hypothetical protein
MIVRKTLRNRREIEKQYPAITPTIGLLRMKKFLKHPIQEPDRCGEHPRF